MKFSLCLLCDFRFFETMSIDESYRSVTCQASPNIALIKYWGKKNEDLILPDNDSLSITLDLNDIHSHTTISTSSSMTSDVFYFDGVQQVALSGRMKKVLDEVRRRCSQGPTKYVEIRSSNTFPASSGLASSASAYACLAVALTQLFQLDQPQSTAAYLARIGSGSAVRSVYGGFVRWSSEGECLSSCVYPAEHWPELRIVVLIFNSSKKPVSSTDAMQRTRETSTLFPARLATVNEKLEKLIEAIRTKDFNSFARIVMTDSNQFHAVCMDTYPPVIYLNAQSKHFIDLIHAYNQIDGNANMKVAYTFDAGPNPFCFIRQQDLDEFLNVIKYFYPTTNNDVHTHVVNSTQAIPSIPVSVMPDVLERIVLTKIGNGPKIIS
jgi:diphosphomevalonate decarboxylase